MDITVCICTHNRPAYLRDCLDGLSRQTVDADRFDILVVDSASTGDAPAQIERLVADVANARLLRIGQAGVACARNTGAAAARGSYVAYIDDDAIPAPDWIECILVSIADTVPPAALIGGRILPSWEAPLPAWWPPELRGILSIIEFAGQGEYRSAGLPADLAPYGANMVVHVPTLLAIGGFGRHSGRVGTVLLSDEDVQLAWRLQAAGFSARHDPRIVVRTRRLLGAPGAVWRELPRRLTVAALLAPFGVLPRHSTRLLPCRWRLAYAAGFIRAALGPGLVPGE